MCIGFSISNTLCMQQRFSGQRLHEDEFRGVFVVSWSISFGARTLSCPACLSVVAGQFSQCSCLLPTQHSGTPIGLESKSEGGLFLKVCFCLNTIRNYWLPLHHSPLLSVNWSATKHSVYQCPIQPCSAVSLVSTLTATYYDVLRLGSDTLALKEGLNHPPRNQISRMLSAIICPWEH